MQYSELLQTIKGAGAQLIAVSKTKSVAEIMHLYEQGQRDFGENRVAELVDKYERLPKDIRWHFIGHLQRNKVKDIVPFVHLIHSIDSLRLLREINKQAAKIDRKVAGLLQFHIAEEESKYGFDWAKAQQMLQEIPAKDRAYVVLSGVMGMATYTDDTDKIQQEFRRLRQIFQQLRAEFFANQDDFKEISMGMSGDYPIALAEGSTMVRIGSLLFGARV